MPYLHSIRYSFSEEQRENDRAFFPLFFCKRVPFKILCSVSRFSDCTHIVIVVSKSSVYGVWRCNMMGWWANATNKQLLCIIKSNLCSCFNRLAYSILLNSVPHQCTMHNHEAPLFETKRNRTALQFTHTDTHTHNTNTHRHRTNELMRQDENTVRSKGMAILIIKRIVE